MPKRRPGPKPGLRPAVRHRTRAVHKYWNPLHVTMRAVSGLPSFRTQTLFGAFERAVRTTRRNDFRVVEYSIQDDHLHLIVEARDNDALARGMTSFSVRANRLFNAASGRRRGRVWAGRYHRRDLTNARQVRNALVYCLCNYKKHQRLTSGAARIDPCSSARWFQGWTALRAHDDGPRPGEEPRTILLARAWHKHGFIHPGERPAMPS
jgi:REP element-mobilizing transposase RayT